MYKLAHVFYACNKKLLYSASACTTLGRLHAVFLYHFNFNGGLSGWNNSYVVSKVKTCAMGLCSPGPSWAKTANGYRPTCSTIVSLGVTEMSLAGEWDTVT